MCDKSTSPGRNLIASKVSTLRTRSLFRLRLWRYCDKCSSDVLTFHWLTKIILCGNRLWRKNRVKNIFSNTDTKKSIRRDGIKSFKTDAEVFNRLKTSLNSGNSTNISSGWKTSLLCFLLITSKNFLSLHLNFLPIEFEANTTIWHCYSYHESICNYSVTHNLSPVPVKPVRTPWTVNWIWNANKIMSRRSVLHKRWYEDLNPIYFLAVVLFVKIEKILLCTWTLPRLLQCL